MRSRFLPTFAAGLMAVLSAFANSAHAGVVFGNLGASGTGLLTNTNTDVGPSLNYFLAQGFTAASPDLAVTSVTLGLFGDGTIQTTVGIFADNFGSPAATPLFTSGSVDVSAKGKYEFSFSGASLTNGSTYWVIPLANVSWYTAGPAPTVQNASGYTFVGTAENDGSGWDTAGSNRYSVSVSAVPEPSTYALSAIGVIATGMMQWRRRAARRAC
jgi:hypothetical protein